MMNPSASPTATPIENPASVVQNVFHACSAIGPAKVTNACAISLGAGKMKDDTLKMRQIASHTTMIATVRSQGAAASMRRWRGVTSPSPHYADLLAQLVDNFGECVRVRDFEV